MNPRKQNRKQKKRICHYLPLIILLGLCTGSPVSSNTQLGPRPLYLVGLLDEGALKQKLLSCSSNPAKKSDFSISHRGAPLQFPEHTRESYLAAASMGAGLIECDVTFTQDRELVCRHSQCDLHKTTNILAVPELAAKCSNQFTPAELHPKTGEVLKAASAECCTSDITVDEFLSLQGKMDAANSSAVTVEDYLGGTAPYRTDLYTERGTLMTHQQSIALFESLDVKMIPELKSPQISMPYDEHYSQRDYAQQLVDHYRAAGIKPESVWMQSFSLDDIDYWLEAAPDYAEQAVYLDGRYSTIGFDPMIEASWNPGMEELAEKGVRFIAPPLWVLLQLSDDGEMMPSNYAVKATEAGLKLLTWTLERSGFLSEGGGWYYQSVSEKIDSDGDMLVVLDVLAKQVGISGVFSDWPATTTYYANCMDL